MPSDPISDLRRIGDDIERAVGGQQLAPGAVTPPRPDVAPPPPPPSSGRRPVEPLPEPARTEFAAAMDDEPFIRPGNGIFGTEIDLTGLIPVDLALKLGYLIGQMVKDGEHGGYRKAIADLRNRATFGAWSMSPAGREAMSQRYPEVCATFLESRLSTVTEGQTDGR